MADVTKIVDVDGTQGVDCDYTSLNAWNSNEATDLVSAGDTHTVSCRSSAGSPDTPQVDMASWTTNATYTLTVKQADSDRHSGQWDTSLYRHELSGATGSSIVIRTGYAVIDGLQIKHLSSGSGYAPITVYSASQLSYNITVKNCIVWGDATTVSPAYGMKLTMPGNSGSELHVYNNLVYDFDGATSDSAIYLGSNITSNVTVYVQNNTIVDCYKGVEDATSSGIIVATNNLIRGAHSGYGFSGTFDSSSDYNSSNDSTATSINFTQTSGSPWNSSGDSDSDYFADAANDDYRPPSGGLQIDVGYDLSGTVDYDAVGTSRPQGSDYDLGFFEYVSGGGGSTYNESVTLAANASCSGAAAQVLEATMTLSTSAGISEGSQADLIGTVDLSISAGLSLFGNLIMEAAATLAASAGMDQQGAIAGSTYEESLTLAAAAEMAQTLAVTLEEVLTLAVGASMDQAANIDAELSLTLGAILEQVQSAQWEGEASLVLSAAAAMIQAGNIEGATILAHQFVIYLSQKSHDREVSQRSHTARLSKNEHDLLN